MAPSTRLQVHPERRINYAGSSRSKPTTRRSTKKAQPSNSTKRKRIARVMTGAVVKARAQSRMPPKSSEPEKDTQSEPEENTQPEPEKNTQPETEECLLCTDDFVSHSNAPKDACAHFHLICKKCTERMLNVKAAQRQLKDVRLEFPFPECDYMLGFKNLRTFVDEAAFKAYDIAVTKYLLSTDKSYMSCISVGCGLVFCIEDTKGNKICKQWVECPYCDSKTCMQCNRPWAEHREGGCDQIKVDEDQKSLAKIKEMGAKRCPSCGVEITKRGGCNHMMCAKCKHHFCWKCLSEYTLQNACECQRAALRNAPINRGKGSDHDRLTQA